MEPCRTVEVMHLCWNLEGFFQKKSEHISAPFPLKKGRVNFVAHVIFFQPFGCRREVGNVS